MDDFEPAKVVEQVEPLRKLLETRDKLRDLLTKVDRSDDLESAAGAGAAEHASELKKLAGRTRRGRRRPRHQKEEA